MALVVGDPLGGASQPDRLIVGFPGKRINGGKQNFTDIGALKGRPGQYERRRPEGVAQTLRRFHMERSDVLERNPKIGAGGVHLQARPNGRVGIPDGLERLAVELASRGCGGRHAGIFFLPEYVVPRLFRVQRRIVEDGSHLRLFAALRQNSQLLLRAVILPGEAEEFEQECAARNIGRTIAEVRRQGGLRVVNLPGVEQLFGRHGRAGD